MVPNNLQYRKEEIRLEIKDCVAVVSGGASGLGEATVRDLFEEGARIAILDINEERGEKIASESGDSVIFCKTDITDGASVQAAIDKSMDTFGAIHVAVNCAGGGPPEKVLSKKGLMPIENFNRSIQLNLIGTMNVIRLAAEQMVKNEPNEDGEKGVVINTASIAAFEGQIGQAAYSASKAGVVGMTLPLSREFADYGIRVLTIAPGLFLTPLTETLPQKVQDSLISQFPFPKRFGKPFEFALLVRQIVKNPMLNGETIRLDGALRMSAR
jgi:NAD(P)-dependent dehydrogenase (short-subunit alcohol dehydrogenase family)